MKTISHALFFCFSLLAPLYAAEPIDENNEPLTVPEESSTDQETGRDSGNENNVEQASVPPLIETDENFVPSIQITEDLPVAFPVDI